MSFHWNPSSDEEEEEEEEEGLDDLWKKSAATNRSYQGNDDSDDDNQQSNTNESFLFGTPSARKPQPVAKLPSGFGDWGYEEEENDGDSVDWEDNDDALEWRGADAKLAAKNTPPLKAVTIDLGSKPPAAKAEKKVKRKTKTRRTFCHKSLPRHLQDLLENLHKSHLLALTSHAFYVSGCCSDEMTLAVAHSLIPPRWWEWNQGPSNDGAKKSQGGAVASNQGPTLEQLQGFCSWFFDLVQHTDLRRQDTLRANLAAGAPRPARSAATRGRASGPGKKRGSSSPESPLLAKAGSHVSVDRQLQLCFYLSRTHDEDPQLLRSMNSDDWSFLEKTALFISMARSLGWRTRFVVAAEPIKRDLNIDHPIFTTAVRLVFHRLSSSKEIGAKGDDERPRKRLRKEKSDTPTCTGSLGKTNDNGMLVPTEESLLGCWVEILCNAAHRKQATGKRGTEEGSPVRWVHVDPLREIIDNPQRVEVELYRLQTPELRKTSKGSRLRPITYALATEHRTVPQNAQKNCLDGQVQLKRITDVTPRYAQSMVESLKLRGQAPMQLLSHWKSDWWSRTVKLLNASFKAPSFKRNQQKSSLVVMAEQRAGISPGDSVDVCGPIALDSDNAAKSVESDGEDQTERFEKDELKLSAKSEGIPTSKAKFKNHPLYVIPSVLKATEVLAPDAKKRVCGVFKGELVYSRNDVSEALAAKKWLYKGRRVPEGELTKPVKRVKARAKGSTMGSFKALKSYGVGKGNDGSAENEQRQLKMASKPLEDTTHVDLFAVWQTMAWSPKYVGPDDPIPVNEYNNVELALLNPGLVHVAEHRVAKVAKTLGIPYAPCLLGFEGHGGNRTPNVHGIVVHEHNATLLRDASVEVVSQTIQDEHESRQTAIYSKWKRLIVGILTKKRLENEYG